jgi:hypothetical protein
MDTRWLKFKGKNRVYVETADGTAYIATPNNNLTLVEVSSNHVAELLLKKCGCCGNQYVCFAIASEQEIQTWKETAV